MGGKRSFVFPANIPVHYRTSCETNRGGDRGDDANNEKQAKVLALVTWVTFAALTVERQEKENTEEGYSDDCGKETAKLASNRPSGEVVVL